jgi:two-component system, cell cycle sensor histidine kinase and response regulator CckA
VEQKRCWKTVMATEQELRVLVVAPTGRDAQLLCDMLGHSGIFCQRCASVLDIAGEVRNGVGAIVVAEEALGPRALDSLSEALADLPAWSDIPIVLLTSNRQRINTAGHAMFRQKGTGGSLILVERPVRPFNLRSVIDAALQTRKRQYEIRDHLEERLRSEERLRHSQKLESIGILAGGVAHDFNNLLTGVLGNASLAYESLPAASPVRAMLKDVLDATERAAHLTKQLLAYAGKGRFVIEVLDLSRQVEEISSLLQTSIPKNVHLRLDLAKRVPGFEGDAAQIQQIIMNLVINGAEAIPEGRNGTVTTTTRTEHIDDEYIRTTLEGNEIVPGCYVTLEVQDTGVGMDEATLAHIFDPFFTTKFTGRGLGLAAVIGIVHGHKGALKVDSTPGQGSTFKLLFPATEEPPMASHEPAEHKQALAGTETILVIDDEAVVRHTAAASLQHFGYHVMTAEDGPAGLEIFRGNEDRIAAVLLDMTMPLMSGEETFRQLKTTDPNVRVILSSGYNEVEAIRRFTGKGLAGFIQKPYTSSQLAEKIKSILNNIRFDAK